MNISRQEHNETDVLKRIIALLVSLAGLAESASQLSLPLRVFNLWVIRRGEAAAWTLLDDEEFAVFAAACPGGNQPDEALALAASLRGIAMILSARLAQFRQFLNWWNGDDADDVNGSAIARMARRAIQRALTAYRPALPAGLMLAPPIDTS